MEYLFSQTGQVLKGITDSDSESGPLSDINESQKEDDEGFVDDDIDLTIASVDAVLATRTSATDSAGVYNKPAVCFQCFESQQYC